MEDKELLLLTELDTYNRRENSYPWIVEIDPTTVVFGPWYGVCSDLVGGDVMDRVT